jgi:hypothetical protein
LLGSRGVLGSWPVSIRCKYTGMRLAIKSFKELQSRTLQKLSQSISRTCSYYEFQHTITKRWTDIQSLVMYK